MKTLELDQKNKELFAKTEANKKTVRDTKMIIETILTLDRSISILEKYDLIDSKKYKTSGREKILHSMCDDFKISIDYVTKVMG